MNTFLENDRTNTLKKSKEETRNLVMAGFNQIKEGKTKDFSLVCDRLEKKYKT